jgi:transcriptional antiterminator
MTFYCWNNPNIVEETIIHHLFSSHREDIVDIFTRFEKKRSVYCHLDGKSLVEAYKIT